MADNNMKTNNRRNVKQYIVDAFTDSIFHGNPAAVCILDEWLSDDMMMNIAGENNLAETAFVVREGALSYCTVLVGKVGQIGNYSLSGIEAGRNAVLSQGRKESISCR